jgi:hypothetical protein
MAGHKALELSAYNKRYFVECKEVKIGSNLGETSMRG